MGKLHPKYSNNKVNEIEQFLVDRFTYLKEMRSKLDTEIDKEVEMYNNIDREIRGKADYEEKYEIPYTYTIVNTIVARIQSGIFGQSNYIKTFIEHPEFQDIEKDIAQWLQEELDKIRLKARSRDFIEESLVKRTAWLQLRPINLKKDGKPSKLRIEFDVLDFYDVWHDIKAREVSDTDFFVKKIVKLYELKAHPEVYFNLDELADYEGQDDDHQKALNDIRAKHSGTDSIPEYSKFTTKNNVTDEAEILEYYGEYDMSDEDINDENYKGDIKEVIFTLANREKLIRIEINNIPTKRKRLLFPIRPLRQANSLIGKGIPQLTRAMAHENNEARSLRMDNFKTLIKLLWKYDRNAGVDLEELFSGAGNAIGYEGQMNKDAVSLLPVPNLLREATLMIQEGIQDQQQTTGAVDHVMGTTAGRGISDTASGTKTITEQAMFKFSMYTDNIYDDLVEFINYIAILFLINARDEVELRHPKLIKFLETLPQDLEDSYIFDLELKDISQRRDLERHQWANMIGILGPMVQQAGGNMQELLTQFMNVFQIPNSEKILQPESPQAITAKLMQNPQLAQQVMSMLTQAAGQKEDGKSQAGQTPGVPPGGSLEEQAGNENL